MQARHNWSQDKVSTKSRPNEGNQNQKGVEFFTMFFKLAEGYISKYGPQSQPASKDQSQLQNKNERISSIEKINKFITTIDMRISLEEEQKIDCFIQSLSIIKRITIINTNNIETRSKRLSETNQLKHIKQIESMVVQNMADMALNKFLPIKKTFSNVSQVIQIILESIYEIQTTSGENNNQKKTKKISRKGLKDRGIVYYSLQSGTKIELHWFLIFKIMQSNLSEVNKYLLEQRQIRGEATMAEVFDKYVKKYIRQFFYSTILEKYKELNLFPQLLKAIVQNISQIQLPILPFFLNQAHQIIQLKFKDYISENKAKGNLKGDQFPKINSKEVHSVQNMSVLFELIHQIGNQMISFTASKIQPSVSGICSYCGTRKRNSFERLIYQKIELKIDENSDLKFTICESCCKNLSIEPSNKLNIQAFSPLILSWFWNIQHQKEHKIRQALRGLLVYQSITPSTSKRNKNIEPKVTIADKVAMNNDEQSISKQILQKLYNLFIYLHTNLQVKQIITLTMTRTLIMWNSSDEKTREKTIKMFGKTFVVDFLYNNKTIPQESRSQIEQMGDKIIKGLIHRLMSTCHEVCIASLDFIVDVVINADISIERKQEIFDAICSSITKKGTQFLGKALCSVDRILNRLQKVNSADQKQINLVRIWFSMRTLVCIFAVFQRFFSEEGQIYPQISEDCSKLFHLTLNIVKSTCNQTDPQENPQIIDQMKQFCHKHPVLNFQVDSLKSIPENILISFLSRIKLSQSILRNMSCISGNTLQRLIILSDQEDISPQVKQIIQKNMKTILMLLYEDVLGMKDQICTKKKKRQTTSNKQVKLNIEILAAYINSSSFIGILTRKSPISQEGKKTQLPNSCKLSILSQLLYNNFVNKLTKSNSEVICYKNICEQTKKKTKNQTIDPIYLSSPIEQSLMELSGNLINSIKQTKLENVELEATLLLRINILLGNITTLRTYIVTYQKYSQLFFNQYTSEQQQFIKKKRRSNSNQLLNHFLGLSRCLTIATILVTQYEHFLQLSSRFQEFCKEQLAALTDKGYEQNHKKKMNGGVTEQMISTSEVFKRMYSQTLAVIDVLEEFGDSLPDLKGYFNKILSLLKYYWQVHPKIILSETRLLNILQKINQNTEEGLTMIQCLFKNFNCLLPSKSIELLNFIRQQFSRKFHQIIQQINPITNSEFIETCFVIIYNLLKSGMEGIYNYNKYIFYGLLHENQRVNETTVKIVKQIFAKEASEKIIFTNLTESLALIYHKIFNLTEDEPFLDFDLSQYQKQQINFLSELTRVKANAFLQKDKKQIRLKSTFLKKVSEFIGADINLIKKRPCMFSMIMKILKCQKVVDYCELRQILFVLEKITVKNENEIQILLKKSKQSDRTAIELNYLLAYRDLVSCMAYFSKYGQVSSKIKDYNIYFENNPNPYTELEEVFQHSDLNSTTDPLQKIKLLQQDIITYWQVTLEGVEKVSVNMVKEHNEQPSQDSNETALTNNRRGKKQSKKVKVESNSLDKYERQKPIIEETGKDSIRSRLRPRHNCKQSPV